MTAIWHPELERFASLTDKIFIKIVSLSKKEGFALFDHRSLMRHRHSNLCGPPENGNSKPTISADAPEPVPTILERRQGF
jgi:hypothetical protein